jgi:peptide/nickel transport system permease protein
MRFTDMMLCIPSLVLMVILSAVLKGGVFQLILVIVTFGWMSSARLVRGQVLSLKEQEYVESARAIGASGWRIMYRIPAEVHLQKNLTLNKEVLA